MILKSPRKNKNDRTGFKLTVIANPRAKLNEIMALVVADPAVRLICPAIERTINAEHSKKRSH